MTSRIPLYSKCNSPLKYKKTKQSNNGPLGSNVDILRQQGIGSTWALGTFYFIKVALVFIPLCHVLFDKKQTL